jgi:hypothetical protein
MIVRLNNSLGPVLSCCILAIRINYHLTAFEMSPPYDQPIINIVDYVYYYHLDENDEKSRALIQVNSITSLSISLESLDLQPNQRKVCQYETERIRLRLFESQG